MGCKGSKYLFRSMPESPPCPGCPDCQHTLSHPPTPHYEQTELQPIDVIHAWDLDFFEGNLIKYMYRRKRKGAHQGDLEKMLQYARWIYEREVE